MAVWRLMTPHYLNVPGIEWEYSEITRDGRTGRSRWPVPLYLHPEDPASQTPPNSGTLYVAHQRSPLYPLAQIFVGEPTPDMEPVDDEAMEISDKFRHKWKHPVDSLPGDFSQSLIQGFERQMSEVLKGQNQLFQAPNVSPSVVGVEQFAELTKKMEAMEAELTNLRAEAKPKERRL